jgi:hypothetical protein
MLDGRGCDALGGNLRNFALSQTVHYSILLFLPFSDVNVSRLFQAASNCREITSRMRYRRLRRLIKLKNS